MQAGLRMMPPPVEASGITSRRCDPQRRFFFCPVRTYTKRIIHMPMLNLLFLGAYGAFALAVARVVLAAVFLAHGPMKWSLWKTTDAKPMKGLMKFLSVAEPLGGLGVLFGFLTRWAALGLALVMLGAMYMKIFVWKRTFTGENGWELDLSLFALSVVLLVLGAGAWSLDRVLLGM